MKALTGATVLALLAACGGGGEGAINDTSTWGLNYTSFDPGMSTLSLSNPSAQSFTMTWTAERTGGNPAYYMRVYMVPASVQNPVLNDSVAILGANCGPVITGCDTAGSQACSYTQGATADKRRIDCGSVRGMATGLDRDPGNYLVIGRACYFSPAMEQVCRDKPAYPVILQ